MVGARQEAVLLLCLLWPSLYSMPGLIQRRALWW